MSKKESSMRPSKNRDAIKNEPRAPQSRREALQLLGVTGVSLLVGCGSDTPGTGGATGGAGGATGGAGGATGGGAGISGAGGAMGGGDGTGAGGTTGGAGGTTGGAGGAMGGAAGTGGAAGSGGSTGGAAGKAGSGGAAGASGGAAGTGGTTGGAAGTSGAAGTGGSAGGTAGAGGSAGGAAGSRPDGGAGTDAGTGGGDSGSGSDASVICPSKDTPHVNVGPYYYDSMMNRSDIKDGQTGVPITYRFTVLDANCKPIAGAVVDIWQCDKAGVYSAYASQGTSGLIYLRGFQITDAHGEATFTAVFPGWYSGRLTHLHGKIFLNGVQKDTTNFFFPKAVETAVYNSPLYSGRGQNSVTVAQDVELKGDTAAFTALSMTVTGDVTNGYVATYVIKYS